MSAPGKRQGGGSRKGIPNKVTAELKDMVLGALNEAGGQEYLLDCATSDNPKIRSAFLSLLGRCMPKDVAVSGNLTFTVVTGVPS